MVYAVIIMGTALFVAVLFLPAFLILFGRTKKFRPDAHACRACRYAKRGSDSRTCPECGVDWDEPAPADELRRTELAMSTVLFFFFVVGVPILLLGLFLALAVAVG